jgi:hypothetical protein
MARKSLSSQVIEELDRARGLLNSVVPSVDPIIGHLLGAVVESMDRIEGMCLRARQADANTVLADPVAADVMKRSAVASTKRPASTTGHRAPRSRKEA